MMKVIVTGGAGFIGSCVVRALNDLGIEDIIIVDNIRNTEKWLNVRNKKYQEYIHKDEFLGKLKNMDGITHIIHMGACSATTELDFDYLYKNNFLYTKTLWEYAADRQISFIYASSAATYGGGEYGFDDIAEIKNLKPLNRYGYSKHIFDLWAEKQEIVPKQHVGLKFFNVYGPNEYAKGNMASVVLHGYRQILADNEIRLFKSYNPQYEDGGQLRDFVYVKDVCEVIMHFMKNEAISGLFNVGTGQAENFKTLAESVYEALGQPANIRYIEMPIDIREKYQYYTKANMDKLREAAGYTKEFYSLKEGVKDYVLNYLAQGMEIF